MARGVSGSQLREQLPVHTGFPFHPPYGGTTTRGESNNAGQAAQKLKETPACKPKPAVVSAASSSSSDWLVPFCS